MSIVSAPDNIVSDAKYFYSKKKMTQIPLSCIYLMFSRSMEVLLIGVKFVAKILFTNV